MLKMQTKNGVTIVSEGGKVELIGTILDALLYVEHRRLLAKVHGQSTTTRVDKTYFVRSLIPPTRKKIVTLYILDEEAV